MGAGVLIGAIIGLLILMASPISYFILKYLDYKKAGIVVALLLASIVLIPFFLLYFESELYSKSDARKDLDKLGIELQDDFEIEKNKISGVPEYYQFTDLKISYADKVQIINSIKSSLNYAERDSTEPLRFKIMEGDLWKKDTVISHNFLFKNKITREIYENKPNIIPCNIKIEVSENSNIVKIERIEE